MAIRQSAVMVALLALGCGSNGDGAQSIDARLPPADLPDAGLPPVDLPDAGPLEVGDVLSFDEIAPAAADGEQVEPGIAWTGEAFLVAWIDEQRGVRAVHLDADGEPVEATPIDVGPPGDVGSTLVACTDDGVCAVAWSSDGGVRVRRLAADGTVLDATPLDVSIAYPTLLGVDDGGFLLVWSDGLRVWGLRLGDSGGPLGGGPFLISAVLGLQDRPRLGCDADGCLIELYACETQDTCGVRLARVAADGTVTPPTPAPAIVDVAGLGSLGCAAGVCLMVELAYAPTGHPHFDGAFFDDHGVPLDLPTFPIFAAGLDDLAVFGEPRVIADADGFIVASELTIQGTYPSRVVAKRVSPAGVVSPALPFDLIPSTDQQVSPRVACAPGTERCMVTATVNGATTAGIAVARFAGTTVADVPPIVITRGANHQAFATAAANGDGYLVAWIDTRLTGQELRAARMSATGAWLDTAAVALGPVSMSQAYAAAAWTGDAWLVVWADFDGLFGARLSADGVLLDDPPIRYADTQFGVPSLACHTGGCLLVHSGAGLEATPLAPDGQLAGPPLVVDATAMDGQTAAVTWAGDAFVVAWSGADPIIGDRVAAVRITPDGRLVDLAPVALSGFVPGGNVPVVATVLDDSVVFAWNGPWGSASQTADVGFRVMGANLAARAPAAPLAASDLYETGPQVAALASTALVLWTESDGAQISRVAARRVSAEGTVLDAAPIIVRDVVPLSPVMLVGAGNGDALVVWSELDTSPAIAAQRVRASLIHAP